MLAAGALNTFDDYPLVRICPCDPILTGDGTNQAVITTEGGVPESDGRVKRVMRFE